MQSASHTEGWKTSISICCSWILIAHQEKSEILIAQGHFVMQTKSKAHSYTWSLKIFDVNQTRMVAYSGPLDPLEKHLLQENHWCPILQSLNCRLLLLRPCRPCKFLLLLLQILFDPTTFIWLYALPELVFGFATFVVWIAQTAAHRQQPH